MVRLSIFDNTLVLLVGSLTAFMAALFGLFQADLKRVIAFSTCSQLGYYSSSILFNIYNIYTSPYLLTYSTYSTYINNINNNGKNSKDVIPEGFA